MPASSVWNPIPIPGFTNFLPVNYPQVAPEMFGAQGNGTNDDAFAFQLALNYLKKIGGGELILLNSNYLCEQYQGFQVGFNILGTTIAFSAVSTALWIPGNIRIRSMVGRSKIFLKGVSSSPMGFTVSGGISVAPLGAMSAKVISAVNMIQSSVTVNNIIGLSVGQTVAVCRPGNSPTPSNEDSPRQQLVIQSIDATNNIVYFQEAFFHRFDAAENVQLKYFTDGSDFIHNLCVEGIDFVNADETTTTPPYILFSQCIDLKHDCNYDGCSMSFAGGSQDIVIEDMTFISNPTHNCNMTIESASRIVIDKLIFEGNGNTSSTAFLIDDNCKDITIQELTVSNNYSCGAAWLFGAEVWVGKAKFINCGTNTDPISKFGAALCGGFPAVGAIPTLAIAHSDTYLVRNVALGSIHIQDLTILGASQVPVRMHDVPFTVERAYIEFANPGSSAVFLMGQSGDRRADATYFPGGGICTPKIGKVEVNLLSGVATLLSAFNGISGFFRQKVASITVATASTDTTLTVDDTSQLRPGTGIYYIDPNNTGASNAISRTITAINGNVLTLSAAVGALLVVSQGIWANLSCNDLTRRIEVDRITLNGVVTPVISGEEVGYLNFAGAGPTVFNASLFLAIPAQGNWRLYVSVISSDGTSYIIQEFLVSWAVVGSNTIQTIEQVAVNSQGSEIAVGTATVTGQIVTVAYTAGATGYVGRALYKFIPEEILIGGANI